MSTRTAAGWHSTCVGSNLSMYNVKHKTNQIQRKVVPPAPMGTPLGALAPGVGPFVSLELPLFKHDHVKKIYTCHGVNRISTFLT